MLCPPMSPLFRGACLRFRAQAVTMETLLELAQGDMRECGVSAIGHRKILMAAIERLREQGWAARHAEVAGLDAPVAEGHQPEETFHPVADPAAMKISHGDDEPFSAVADPARDGGQAEEKGCFGVDPEAATAPEPYKIKPPGGKWINKKKRVPAKMEVLIGECPGGSFFACLCLEEEGVKYPDGYPLFQLKAAPVPGGRIPFAREPIVFSVQAAKTGYGSLLP